LLTNPGNPTGKVIPAPLMKEILAWANQKEMHVVIDEIYAISVFAEESSFKSVYSFDSLPNPQKTHIVWGISKDFSLNGLRMG
jgi:aspartate/methionine/tyrosine aminotransferase